MRGSTPDPDVAYGTGTHKFGPPADDHMDSAEASEACRRVLDTIDDAVIADPAFFDRIMVSVLARGHVLLEDVPGTGKTLTARSFATALGLSFSRIQFTPDLLPSDVTGTNVFNERDRSFEFSEGPIFANVVLADEINRAPPKTQAALLEAMEEGQVTVDGETRELPKPFFVIATQNPVDQEGSLHPDETVYMNGELWRAGDALAHAKSEGELLVETDDTKLYDFDATTQTLQPDGSLSQQPCLVYETDYEGAIHTVRTKTGREITVSGNHPFLVNRDGRMEWIEADDLAVDDSLVAPDRLRVDSTPFPSHDAVLDELDDQFDVLRRDRIERLRDRLHAEREGDTDLSADDLDTLRIAAGLSKTALTERVDATYDRVLNYLQGADTAVGVQIADALRTEEITLADCIETHGISRFVDELSDEEAGFFVGFVLSDGSYDETSVKIYQKNHPDAFDRWTDLGEKLGFEVRTREIHGGREAAIDSKPLVEYLDARYDLRNPTRLLDAPEAFQRAFLDVFVLTESHFDTDQRRITFTQKDRETTNLIAHLLLQFGIRPWIVDEERVHRIKIQGEDLRTFVEEFTWPGEEPDLSEFDSVHRSLPVDRNQLERIVELLGIEYAGDMSDRDWYNAYKNLGSGRPRVQESSITSFTEDIQAELAQRQVATVTDAARTDLGETAKQCGLSMTDVVDETELTKHRVWQAYQGETAPDEAVEYVAETYRQRVEKAETLLSYLEDLTDNDVFYDRITEIESEPYEGTVVGLSVPRTHNYVAGFGACGINHNTFPLPEAQVDRFVIKTKIGYPGLEGETELLRRRAGRSTQSPSVEPVLDRDSVVGIREAPESVRVEDDLLSYMAELTHATRQDRRVSVGVSPRGTQRLFEATRAQAVLQGRAYVTPDDIKTIAASVLAHRLVLTPDAQVNDVDKADVIADVLSQVDVPTVE